MRRIKLFCIVSSMLLQSGCRASENVFSNSDLEELSFRQVETPPEGFELDECTALEDEMNIGAFCVYGEDFVYEVNYKDFLTDQTGLKGDIPFEDKYNTQLRRLNMTTGKDELLYKYDAQGCVDTTDIECNDKYCIWTNGYGGESNNIYVYDFDTRTNSVISLGEASCFSYALLGEYISFNQRSTSKYGEEGLYCFSLDAGEYHRFQGLEGKTILHTFQGVDGNVYFQVGDKTSDFRVVNISIK